jgi:hypothetical protein
MNCLGQRFVQHVAVLADPMYELMLSVRSRQFDVLLPRMPDAKIWLGLYRDHRSVLRGIADALPGALGLSGQETEQLLDDSRAVSLHEKKHPGEISKAILSEVSQNDLSRYLTFVVRCAERDYKRHLRELRSDLRGSPSAEDVSEFDVSLHEQSAVYFYIRVILPAMILFRTTPQRLLRQARSGASESDRLDAIEHLVRLDPLAIQMPEIQEWINVDKGAVRLERESMALKWRQQGLDHGQLQRQGYKAAIGALIQSIAKRMGPVLLADGSWREVSMTAQQVRDLFDAVALDRAGLKRGVADTDIESLTPNSWQRQLARYRSSWDELVPSIRGQKSG